MANSGQQWPSVVISGHQWLYQSATIKCNHLHAQLVDHLLQSSAIKCNQVQSSAITCTRSSSTICCSRLASTKKGVRIAYTFAPAPGSSGV